VIRAGRTRSGDRAISTGSALPSVTSAMCLYCERRWSRCALRAAVGTRLQSEGMEARVTAPFTCFTSGSAASIVSSETMVSVWFASWIQRRKSSSLPYSASTKMMFLRRSQESQEAMVR
jgi:hypothetical protein